MRGLACSRETVAAGLTDRLAASFVFVVGCHVSDAGVESDAVVFEPLEFELGLQAGWVG